MKNKHKNNKWFYIGALIVLLFALIAWGIFNIEIGKNQLHAAPQGPFTRLSPLSRIAPLDINIEKYDIPRLFIPPNEPISTEQIKTAEPIRLQPKLAR